VTAIKDAIEDLLKLFFDLKNNYKRVPKIKKGKESKIFNCNIQVGDIIKIKLGEQIQCDCIQLSSSEENGDSYINSANLDGEP
jgi:magnesium-transporting ATPase (P-type)